MRDAIKKYPSDAWVFWAAIGQKRTLNFTLISIIRLDINYLSVAYLLRHRLLFYMDSQKAPDLHVKYALLYN